MANEYRVAQVAIEALSSGVAKAQLGQISIEALSSGVAKAEISQIAIEVLRSVPDLGRRASLM